MNKEDQKELERVMEAMEEKLTKYNGEGYEQVIQDILKIKGLAVLSPNQTLDVEEDDPFIRLDEQAKMLEAGFRRIITE